MSPFDRPALSVVTAGVASGGPRQLLEPAALHRQHPQRVEGGDVADGDAQPQERGVRDGATSGSRRLHGEPGAGRLPARCTGDGQQHPAISHRQH